MQVNYLQALDNQEVFNIPSTEMIPAIQIVDNSGLTTDTMNYLVPYLGQLTR